jgi:hypothetical protein
VIQVPETVFASAAAAAGMPAAALDHLAAADWAPLGTAAHAAVPARLQRAQAKLTAAHAAVPAAFTAPGGRDPDGYRPARAWLIDEDGMAKAAAGWSRRLARRGRVAEAMAAGDLTASCAAALRQMPGAPAPEQGGTAARAVILRGRHCARPGDCDKPPAGCRARRIVPRTRGVRTRLPGLMLLCARRHQVCFHRLGWTFACTPTAPPRPAAPRARSCPATDHPPLAWPGHGGITRPRTSGTHPDARRAAPVRQHRRRP